MSRADVLITVPELAAALERDAVTLLDVRWRLGEPHGAGAARYAVRHLPGARFLDLEAVLTRHTGDPRDGRHPLPELDALATGLAAVGVRADRQVVVYDEAGSFAAGRAWWVLRWAALDVRVLDGGIEAWEAAGMPLTAANSPVTPGGGSDAPELHLRAGHLPTLTADQAALVGSGGVLVDVRAPERFRGETEPLDPQAGHIPGAVNIPVSGLFAGADTAYPGGMPSEQVLRERLAPVLAAVTAGEPIGVYCGSGVSAAQAVLALASLGVQVPLYAGSWSAWSNDPARPVATGA
jgi:thiosulfate/3-mercaptopyruvate sulfurtransferase